MSSLTPHALYSPYRAQVGDGRFKVTPPREPSTHESTLLTCAHYQGVAPRPLALARARLPQLRSETERFALESFACR